MTVCVGAISEHGTIIGAADTMLTSGDIQFEPGRSPAIAPRWGKIYNITNSIVAMTAGDMGIQSEILFDHVSPVARQWISDNPGKWLPFNEAIHIYCDCYNLVRHEKATRAILSPFGLTYEAFLNKQKTLDPAFVRQVTSSLAEFRLPDTATIIAGVEPALQDGTTFSRLAIIHGDDVQSTDVARFAAVGIGARLANSHFMISGYGSEVGLQETLLSVYTAKKKAEVAPGVGRDTIMFILGPALGSFQWLKPEVQARVDHTFQRLMKTQKAAVAKAHNGLNRYLKELTQTSIETPQTSPGPSSS